MTNDAPRAERAASFGAAAALYEQARPSYPEEAVDWLLPPGTGRVLDLGAGTGKLTRQLLAKGWDVVAVEPSDGMRQQLRRSLPSVPALKGTAEDIPLDDAAVDVVLVAQAWHWVDVDRAVPEVARVLVPGGRLGLVWNERDERHDWVAQLSRAISSPDEVGKEEAPPVGPPFGPFEHFAVEWSQHLTPKTLVDLVASRSYVLTLPEPQCQSVLAKVRELLGHCPDLAGRQDIWLPYVTNCYRAHLR
jgi:SAM-dependent methyltransferase